MALILIFPTACVASVCRRIVAACPTWSRICCTRFAICGMSLMMPVSLFAQMSEMRMSALSFACFWSVFFRV